jgi:hypothetical protein
MEKDVGKPDKHSRQEEGKKTKLVLSQYGGRAFVGAQVPYQHGFFLRQVALFDKLLSLAELPAPGEFPKILALSAENGIPAVWRRARASVLENDAAALLTALACSSKKHQPMMGDN